MGALIFMNSASNTQLQQREDSNRYQEQQNQPIVLGIAAHIRRAWELAKIAKQPIERQMLKNLRQRKGEYEPDKLAEIKSQGGSEIYMMITAAKCEAAEAWLQDIFLSTSQPWGLEPDKIPDLPRQVSDAIVTQLYQEAMSVGWQVDDQAFDDRMQFLRRQADAKLKEIAQQICARHEKKIADQFQEGRFEPEFKQLLFDFVTHPAAIIKAPVIRKRKRLVWQVGQNGKWMPVVTEQAIPEIQRRSPFDIYPAPGMTDIQNGDLIDRYRFSRQDLSDLIGVDGYSKEGIQEILNQYGDRGNREWLWGDQQRAELENRKNEFDDPNGWIDCINYWGSVSGKMLNEWDSKKDLSGGEGFNPWMQYQVEAWQCGNYMFKVVLNPDALGRKPYHKACYEDQPGAFWGRALPEKLADTQSMCNASARALSNNMGIASGPQVEIDIQRLPMGETVSQMYPWKITQVTTDLTGNNQPAVRFFQPTSNAQELLGIYTHFERVSDNISGIPNYAYGDSRVGGAGRTAHGLSQLMQNVTKSIRRIALNLDGGALVPIVLRFYDYNMLYDPDQSIKGALHPIARGSIAELIREQRQARRMEFLQATLNPMDAQIIGVGGRAEVLRVTAEDADLGLDVEKVIPDKFELELRAARMPQPWQVAGNGAGGGSQPGDPSAPGGTLPAPDPGTLDQHGATVTPTDPGGQQ